MKGRPFYDSENTPVTYLSILKPHGQIKAGSFASSSCSSPESLSTCTRFAGVNSTKM